MKKKQQKSTKQYINCEGRCRKLRGNWPVGKSGINKRAAAMHTQHTLHSTSILREYDIWNTCYFAILLRENMTIQNFKGHPICFFDKICSFLATEYNNPPPATLKMLDWIIKDMWANTFRAIKLKIYETLIDIDILCLTWITEIESYMARVRAHFMNS